MQLAYMKMESLVIVNHYCYGESVSWSCTHRPSHARSLFFLKISIVFELFDK